MMPGNSGSPARSFRIRLSRISDLTERRARRPASTSLRSTPRVAGLEDMASIVADVPRVLTGLKVLRVLKVLIAFSGAFASPGLRAPRWGGVAAGEHGL